MESLHQLSVDRDHICQQQARLDTIVKPVENLVSKHKLSLEDKMIQAATTAECLQAMLTDHHSVTQPTMALQAIDNSTSDLNVTKQECPSRK